MSCGDPLRMSVSVIGNEAEQEAVVCVRRSDWESVMEREELVGRLRVGSRFPQYLAGGLATCGGKDGRAWKEGILHYRYVDRGSSAGPVDFLVFHNYTQFTSLAQHMSID